MEEKNIVGSYQDEIFRVIVGYGGKYYVSNYGNIYSIKIKKNLIPFKIKNGYNTVRFYHQGKHYTHYVHRLVAVAFLENIDRKPYVNHKDRNRINNKVNNLEWCTCLENNHHAKVRGSYSFKLTNETAKMIKTSKLKTKKLSLLFNVSTTTIKQVRNGKIWTHV